MGDLLKFPVKDPCHICTSKINVERKRLMVFDWTGDYKIATLDRRESSLCKKCRGNRWELINDQAIRMKKTVGRKVKYTDTIGYVNWYIGEIKIQPFPVHTL